MDQGQELQSVGITENQETTPIKYPIFIATAEADLVRAIDKLLFEEVVVMEKDEDGVDTDKYLYRRPPLYDKDQYVLMVLSQPIFQSMHKDYLFKLLGQDEQKRQREVILNEQLQEQAQVHAIQLGYKLTSYRRNKLKNYPEAEILEFNEPELKTILAATSPKKDSDGKPVRVTHQNAWDLMDLLLLQGFIEPIDLTNTQIKKEKKRYKLIVDNGTRLKHLESQLEKSEHDMVILNKNQIALKNEILKIRSNSFKFEKQKTDGNEPCGGIMIKEDPNIIETDEHTGGITETDCRDSSTQ